MNELIGMFRRPQVVQREIDRSARPRVVQDNGVITLVPGVSKTGPHNQLKRISNAREFENFYGRRDRNLEFKGSYFHLSALNALRTGPILALSLLETDDELDKINSVSLSTSAWYDNDPIESIPYSDLFNKQSFWSLDTDIYKFNVNQGSNVIRQTLHFANTFDRKVTIWAFKSSLRGFDVTAREWYANTDLEKPTHIDDNDLISDHMIKVLIVEGDYTDTESLTNDSFFNRFFNSNGLRKDQVNSFIQEPSVNVLGNYDVSLIPYFVDNQGIIRYIESVINAETSITGVFVAHELESLQGEPRNGLVDLIGETLTQTPNKEQINMLSYQTNLNEDVYYEEKSLDHEGNVWGLPWPLAGPSSSQEWRNGLFANGYIYGLNIDPATVDVAASFSSHEFTTYAPGDTTLDLVMGANQDDPYVIYDNTKVDLLDLDTIGDSVTLELEFPEEGSSGNNDGFYRIYTIALNNDGEVYAIQGSDVDHSDVAMTGFDYRTNGSDQVNHPLGATTDIQEAIEYDFMRDTTTATPATAPYTGRFKGALLPTNSDPVLGVVFMMTHTNDTTSDYTLRKAFYYPVAVDNDAADSFIEPALNVTNPSGNNTLDIEFRFTTNDQISNSDGVWTRRNLFYYNDYNSRISNDSMMVFNETADGFGVLKLPVSSLVVVKTENGVDDRAISITAPTEIRTGDTPSGALSDVASVDFTGYSSPSVSTDSPLGSGTGLRGLLFYQLDDELALGSAGVRTRANIYDDNAAGDDTGVIGKANRLYLDYQQGFINTDDVVHARAISIPDGQAEFDNVTYGGNTMIIPDSGLGYVANDFEYANTQIKVKTGTGTNDNIYEITNVDDTTLGGSIILTLDKAVINEITSADIFFAFNQVTETRYIKAYKFVVDGDQVIKLEFVSAPGESVAAEFTPTNLANNNDISGLVVTSNRSNFEQTLEIEKQYTNSKQIGVSATRYTEVVIGDYILAKVDPTTIEPGEVPRYWTRIVDKFLDPADPTIAILETDQEVEVTGYPDANAPNGVDLQTKTYKTLDNYVDEYVGFGLEGFKIRPESLPDGTQERQDRILNLISRNTPLFKGLVDKRSTGGSWRYLIDTFGLGLQANSKQQYADLCGAKLNCLGFISAPSERQFRQSSNPSFLNPDGTLNYSYIRKGNNPNTVGAFRFTLADGEGRSNVAYFYPYMVINDNGVPLRVPPASYVHNTYRQAFLTRSGSIFPWTPKAGLDNGTVTGISATEIPNILPDDLTELHDAHINPIFFEADTDYVIGDQRTAQIRPRTALSSINVREMLISLENELFNMLIRYQWRLNTPELRQEVFGRANAICQRFQDNFGIFAYENVVDESNNTFELIDDEKLLLETFIEPTRATATIVNDIYILRTGDLSSSGFSTQQ